MNHGRARRGRHPELARESHRSSYAYICAYLGNPRSDRNDGDPFRTLSADTVSHCISRAPSAHRARAQGIRADGFLIYGLPEILHVVAVRSAPRPVDRFELRANSAQDSPNTPSGTFRSQAGRSRRSPHARAYVGGLWSAPRSPATTKHPASAAPFAAGPSGIRCQSGDPSRIPTIASALSPGPNAPIPSALQTAFTYPLQSLL